MVDAYEGERAQAGRSCSEAIDAAVAGRAMLSHPFYQAWTAGLLSREALREYSRQYFHHVEAFPRVVSAAHAQCPDPAGRRMLAENLAEEEGLLAAGQEDHARLWLRFAEALGADEAAVRAVDRTPETQALIDTFARLSQTSYAAALGALYAYESQLPAVASTKIAGLARYGIDDARAIRFFSVHEKADELHAEVCRNLLNALPANQAEAAVEAGAALAQALWGFLDGIERTTGARAAA